MLPARYFDGRSARAWPASLTVDAGDWLITLADSAQGPKLLRFDSGQAQAEEALEGLPRRLKLPEGAMLEVEDQAGFDRMMLSLGKPRSLVDQAQGSWRVVIILLALTIVTAVAGYLWLLPWGANQIALRLPPGLEKTIGDQAWPSIDKEYFQPSALDPKVQARLREGFEQIRRRDPRLPDGTELLFRASKIGPNAIAVPGGRVVMTDEMVDLALKMDKGQAYAEQALLGVLAHEIGHLHHRHSMRNLLQAAAVTAVVSLWLGDISTLVTAVPTLLLQMKYSRDFESEADDYAVRTLDAAGLPRAPTADLFDAMMALGKADSVFSSHPPTAERARKFRGMPGAPSPSGAAPAGTLQAASIRYRLRIMAAVAPQM